MVDEPPNLKVRETDPAMYLSGLYIYPTKPRAGIPLEASGVDERGLRNDRRRWMLVDESGRFMSQRRSPRMALIRVRSERDGLGVPTPLVCPHWRCHAGLRTVRLCSPMSGTTWWKA